MHPWNVAKFCRSVAWFLVVVFFIDPPVLVVICAFERAAGFYRDAQKIRAPS
jgi:hypothetical protein